MNSQQVRLDSLEDLLDVMAVGNPVMQRMLTKERVKLATVDLTASTEEEGNVNSVEEEDVNFEKNLRNSGEEDGERGS
ncbi:hypothetical protein Bca52824_075295 [Brassica carinata]|uniref:Uncharacterized protein n=1 Tax=Brassica carinata TaxID=52824 RepID=A0A8X7PQ35_BRACI|nr:hypothetical protein Bca52824_075295 [Brassica carinata]